MTTAVVLSVAITVLLLLCAVALITEQDMPLRRKLLFAGVALAGVAWLLIWRAALT